MPSLPLTRLINKPVFLKLENLQLSGSFKARGVGHFCDQAAQRGARQFVVAPGGNSSLAVAQVGRALELPVHAILPTMAPFSVVRRLLEMGTTVTLHGVSWAETQAFAVDLAKKEGTVFVPSYDHPDIWEGHSSIVDEIVATGIRPGAIVLSASGGGLLCGIIQGLWRVGWKTPVIATEFRGTASLGASMRAFDVVPMAHSTRLSVYFTGTTRIARRALDRALECRVVPVEVDEADAISACCRFVDDHHMVVEPITGAALSLLYKNAPILAKYNSILVIVCGGNSFTIAEMEQTRQRLGPPAGP